MSTVADSSINIVTNLRDVIDVPVPVVDVVHSSLRVPSLSSDEPALSTKFYSFLRKSTDASPSRTTSPSVPSEVKIGRAHV